MPGPKHILIVDDDPVACATLSAYIGNAGYQVSVAPDSKRMRDCFANENVDLMLLDIGLPDEDGLSLLREIRRQSEVGIIMVTNKSEDVDRIVALELGADDYVIKPFNMRELMARCKNLIRRTQAASMVRSDQPVMRFAGWTINTRRRALTSPSGTDVRLTKVEFDLLATLVKNSGRVLSRNHLIERVSGRDRVPSDRTIDVLIGRLRGKIETSPKEPQIIITVHGVGYVLAG